MDVDDTIIEVHEPKKQGAGFGYSGVRGLNALLATVSTDTSAPVIIAQRLRKGAAGSPRSASRIVADALKTVARPPGKKPSQPALFDTYRFHAFFTTSSLDTVTADQVHRRHAIIEQVNADLKSFAFAHLPLGVFTANAAWLVLAMIAFNLTRAAATITSALASATTAAILRKLVQIPARTASSARRIRLRLPGAWP